MARPRLFILSKGHGCVALYAVLRQAGFLTEQDIEGFCRKGGILGEHPDMTKVPGVEASTGLSDTACHSQWVLPWTANSDQRQTKSLPLR